MPVLLPPRRRALAAALLLSAAVLTAGCSENAATETYKDTETYGAMFATAFATAVPFRKAFSAGEAAAAEYLKTELRELGYDVAESFFDANGTPVPEDRGEATSRNLVATRRGTGFRVTDPASGETRSVRRTVLLCAHYDTLLGSAEAEAAPGYDGIQDNASGIAALLQAARALKSEANGFDVRFAFFGAGGADQLGARVYLSGLSDVDLAGLEAVYCVESIYAGDKLYANAGWSSLAAGRKYAMRKKLYEMTDLAIKYSIDLRTNQAGFSVDLLGDGAPVLFREVSSNKSDWVPFDAKGIPVVFFESYDFFARSLDATAESRNPAFSTTMGRIRGTPSDGLAALQEILDADRLKDRVDRVAFLLQKMVERGIDEGTADVTPQAATATPTGTPEAGS